MAKVMLYHGTLTAFYSSSEFWTQDDIFVRVYTDDNTFVRWPAGNGVVKFERNNSADSKLGTLAQKFGYVENGRHDDQ